MPAKFYHQTDELGRNTTKRLVFLRASYWCTLGPYVPDLWKYFRHFSQITQLLGEWHSYHFSRMHFPGGVSPVFRHGRVLFKRSFRGLKMYSTYDKTRVMYTGRVFFDVGHVVITGEGVRPRAVWHGRYSYPTPNERPMMIGIQLSQDFSNDMFATVELVIKDDITEDEAKIILAYYAELVVSEHSLRLRREARLY